MKNPRPFAGYYKPLPASARKAREAEETAYEPNYRLLANIGRKLMEQDNLATAHPIFMVQSKGRFGQWQNVQPFFTREAADHYIYLNGHNLRSPRIYVESAFRNAEWQALRALFIAAAKGEQL